MGHVPTIPPPHRLGHPRHPQGKPGCAAPQHAPAAVLDARELRLLAQADALAPTVGNRHQAAWAVAGVDTRAAPLLREARTEEAPLALPSPGRVEDTLADYRATGLSLKAHPVGLLRDALRAFQVEPAAVLQGFPDGRLARAKADCHHCVTLQLDCGRRLCQLAA